MATQRQHPDGVPATGIPATANVLADILLRVYHLDAESPADTLAQIRDLAKTSLLQLGASPARFTKSYDTGEVTAPAPANVRSLTGRALPDGWEISRDPRWYQFRLSTGLPDAQRFDGPEGLEVIEELRDYEHADGTTRQWHHLSISRPDRLPSWRDLNIIKRTWMGKDTFAYQVLAPDSEHFNHHPFCLHIWRCPSEPDLIPNFAAQNGGGV